MLKDLLKTRSKLLINNNNDLNVDNVDCAKCGGGRNLTVEIKNSSINKSIDDDNCTLNIKINNNNTLVPNATIKNTNLDKLRRTYEEKLLTQLNNEQKRYIIDYQTASALCYFESTVKRKCIMKNSQKPHFSQWHSYWLQLVGNVLVYYSSKLNLLPSTLTTSSTVTSSSTISNTNVLNSNLTSSCQSVKSDSICNEQY